VTQLVEERGGERRILAVFPPGNDRTLFERILSESGWELECVQTFEEACIALRARPFRAVISENRFPDGHCWKDILVELQALITSPQLIVTDRLADEALWAEVLNLGGYDVLMKPFDSKEVVRTLDMASRFWLRAAHASSAHGGC